MATQRTDKQVSSDADKRRHVMLDLLKSVPRGKRARLRRQLGLSR